MTGVVGSRVHPRTGVRIVYVAAVLASEAEARMISEALADSVNPDGQELTEIRWVSLVEADELMGEMIYEPILIHLQQTLHRARM